MSSIVPILRKEDLVKLPTKALRARLQRLYACEESVADSDRVDGESHLEKIEFKDTLAWHSAYGDVKEVLATREHVPKGPERRAARLARAKRPSGGRGPFRR